MDESIVKHLEQQQTMKLSQAIREGAKLRPQCFLGTAWRGSACANMSAAEALGLPYEEGLSWRTVRSFLLRKGYSRAAIYLAVEMNDVKLMRREQIADQLEAFGY